MGVVEFVGTVEDGEEKLSRTKGGTMISRRPLGPLTQSEVEEEEERGELFEVVGGSDSKVTVEG